MLTLLLTIAGAFFNACMDRMEEGRFLQSVFAKWDKRFWYKDESWKHAVKIFNYPIDGWHLSKSAMLLCMLSAPFVYRPLFNLPWDLFTNYILWIVAFNLFYNKILKLKNPS